MRDKFILLICSTLLLTACGAASSGGGASQGVFAVSSAYTEVYVYSTDALLINYDLASGGVTTFRGTYVNGEPNFGPAQVVTASNAAQQKIKDALAAIRFADLPASFRSAAGAEATDSMAMNLTFHGPSGEQNLKLDTADINGLPAPIACLYEVFSSRSF